MELRAVYEALRAYDRQAPLQILADSQYVIRVFTEWLPDWKSRGWRTAGKKPVMNRDAIEMIESELLGRDVVWEHVRGHAGHQLNERVDKLARAEAERIRSSRGP